MSSLNNSWSKLIFDRKNTWLFVIIVVSLIVSSILGALVPHWIRDLADQYDVKVDYVAAIFQLGVLYFAIYLNRAFYQLAINKFIKLAVQKIRNEVYERWLLSHELRSKRGTDRYPQGEVIARIMSDTLAFRELMTSGTFGIVIEIVFVISFLVSFIQMNLVMGAGLALAEGFALVLLVMGGKYMRDVFHRVRKARGLVSQQVANVVGGLQDAYFTRSENYATKTGKVAYDHFYHTQFKANVWDASYYSLAESLYPLLLVLVAFLFPYAQITSAALILALIDLIQRSNNPLKSIAGKITNIQRAVTGFQRINEFTSDLRVNAEDLIDVEDFEYRKLKGMKVSIRHFEYPKRANQDSAFSLEQLEFEGKKGQLIGLVGTSGCGKSTLFNILSSNLIAQDGTVELTFEDGESWKIDLSSEDEVAPYRAYTGLVSQESHIFSETLEFNLTLGQKEREDLEAYWQWIKEKIPYFVEWEIELDQKISPEGLSAGQVQLIAAIRALFLKKPIVLFDEISSALDSDLELALRDAVALAQKESLTFIVAHRLETVRNADLIILLEEGRMVAKGTHQELTSSSQLYCEFLAELTR